MCDGPPLVLGDEAIDGNLGLFLIRLYAAGVRPDRERAARSRPAVAHADLNTVESYRVLFTGAA